MTKHKLIETIYGLTDKDSKIIENLIKITPEQIAEDNSGEIKRSLAAFYNNVLEGVLYAMVTGYKFIDEEEVIERLGMSIKENYKSASDEFIKVANGYWTFKLSLDTAIDDANRNDVTSGILGRIELQLGSVFFPTPGLIKMSQKKREKAQREILEDFLEKQKIDFNLENYFNGNPLLTKKKFKIW